jgi:phenylpyruvate tautomerase PptA (4-oxalocrotonate tautomerase family)
MFLRDNGEIGGFAMCKEHLKKKKKKLVKKVTQLHLGIINDD